MSVLKLGLDKIDIANNFSYSLPMILTYTVDEFDDDIVYLKVHPNKNLLELLPDNNYEHFELWIERGGRRKKIWNCGGCGSTAGSNNHSGTNHISKSGGYRARTYVCSFTRQQMQSYINNDSIPVVTIFKSNYDWGGWHSLKNYPHVYVRASIRKQDVHFPHRYTGINSNKIKINY